MRKLRKKKEAVRRIVKKNDRTEHTQEGETKTAISSKEQIKKARSKPLSVASKKALREEENGKTPTPGLSDYFRKKHADSANLAHLPTGKTETRTFAVTKLKAKPVPTKYWLQMK